MAAVQHRAALGDVSNQLQQVSLGSGKDSGNAAADSHRKTPAKKTMGRGDLADQENPSSASKLVSPSKLKGSPKRDYDHKAELFKSPLKRREPEPVLDENPDR